MTPIKNLMNIGPRMVEWLTAIGIETEDDLLTNGIVETYRQMKDHDRTVSLNALWALQGAVMGLKWNEVPMDIREELRANLAELDESDSRQG